MAAELLERSNKRSIDEALAAAYPRATYQIQRLRKAGFKQEEIVNSASSRQTGG